MKTFDMEQGSTEWLNARLGLPTASQVDRILTPKTLKPSSSALTYRNQLLCEWYLGHPVDWTGQSGFMDRGRDLEARARALYELENDCDVEQVGFITRDDGMFGCSPDGLVRADGLIEIKTPALHTHIGYLIAQDEFVAEYRGQIQAEMYVTGRQWCDLMAFNPELPSVTVRVERDEKYINALEAALEAFIEHLLAARELLAPHRQLATAIGG